MLEVFGALSERRPEGHSSVRPLAFSEIDAYARLMGQDLSPEFVRALLMIDRSFIDACEEVRKDHKAREET